MYLKNIVIDKPEGVKMCPVGKTVYVYHVIESTYNPDKRYNTDKRVSIGKMISGSKTKMIPNDRFGLYYPELLAASKEFPKPPVFSQTLHAGAVVAERRIAQDLGLLRILSDIYGSAVADEIMGIVSFVLTDESAVFQHYPAFIRKHLSADRSGAIPIFLPEFSMKKFPMRESLKCSGSGTGLTAAAGWSISAVTAPTSIQRLEI